MPSQSFRFLSDAPGGQEHLWEGLRSFADRLAKLVPCLPKNSPVLLSGSWGSGKTTLLQAVRRQLEGECWEEGQKPLRTVWFEAWRYEGEVALLPALVRAVWRDMPGKEEEAVRATAHDLYKRAWDLAGKVALKYAPEVLRASGLPFAPFLADHFDTLKGLVPEKADLADRLKVPEEDPSKRLRDSFSKLLEIGWKEQPPVIFIDDLDRCSPEGAVALLDAIRMLVSYVDELPGHFILALDRSVMASAIARKFEGIGDYDGNRYLEKIFPIAFELPEPRRQEAERLVRQFLHGEPTDDLEADHRDALTQALAEPIFANPRLMKRCINRFRLTVFLEKDGDTEEANPEDRASGAKRDRFLAKWIAATQRWPTLRRLVGQHADSYWREVSSALSDKETVNDQELNQLLMQRGARGWLRREMLSGKVLRIEQFRDADRRLRRWGL